MALDDLTRYRDRRTTDRAELDHLLDELKVGTLSTVTTDGQPWAVPLLHARDGDRVLLHGSTGAGALRHVADGAPAVFSVFVMDALVLASTMFDTSCNYRSATIRGHLQPLTGQEAWTAMERISDRLVPGRSEEVLPMTKKHLAATTVLALEITDDHWILKQRTGGTGGEGEDPDDLWTGVVPVVRSYAEPERSPWLGEVPVPPSVRRLRGE